MTPAYSKPPCGRIAALLAAVSLLLTATPAASQPALSLATKVGQSKEATKAPVPASDAELIPEQLRTQLAETNVAIAANETTAVPAGISEEERNKRLRTLKLLAFAYQSHLNSLVELEEQRRISVALEAERSAWNGFPEPPPYSIVMVDRLYDELKRRGTEVESAQSMRKILEAQSEANRNRLKKTQELIRQLQEKVERAKAEQSAAASWQLAQAQLDERSLAENLKALIAAQRTAQVKIEEAEKARDFAHSLVQRAEAQLSFTAQDLTALQSSIDTRQTESLTTLDLANAALVTATRETNDATARLEQARSSLSLLQRDLAELQKKLRIADDLVAKTEKPTGVLQKINPLHGRSEKADQKKLQLDLRQFEGRVASARKEVLARDRELTLKSSHYRNITTTVSLALNRRALLELERAFWELRYAISSNSADADGSRRILYKRSKDLLQLLAPRIEQLRADLDLSRDQMVEQQNAIDTATDAQEINFRQRMLEILTARQHMYRQGFSESEELRQLLQRLVADHETLASTKKIGERAGAWYAMAAEGARSVWSYELFVVEDTIEVDNRKITGTRGVTIGKIVHALLVVILGYFLIDRLSRWFLNSASRRMKIDPMEAQIVRRWLLVVALFLLLLTAAEIVKIPLTAFAFLGGAVAIGFGFGMQTLLKNMISGAMILFERPFRLRDVVEVGGISGEITGINIRSCTIRSVNGIETLVPNSTFLEQNVTNWTLSSHKVRYTVKVGVAYGSPVRKVADLLYGVANEHRAVLSDPPPEVLFEDFGDNALVFALNVWLLIGQHQVASRVTLSELRFKLSEVLEAHGIGIPFPQRDVHLDVSTPIQVKVT